MFLNTNKSIKDFINKLELINVTPVQTNFTRALIEKVVHQIERLIDQKFNQACKQNEEFNEKLVIDQTLP